MGEAQSIGVREGGRGGLDVGSLVIRDLGRMEYSAALSLQRQLQAEVIAGRGGERGHPVRPGECGSESRCGDHPVRGGECGRPARPPQRNYLLLVEHDPPVITVSGRKTSRQNLIANEAQLAKAGVEVAETDRGGDITYHGPGQLVVYPILDLNLLGLRLHGYMRLLEQVVIDTLALFGIEGVRDESATGVWVKSKAHQADAHGLQSVGVRGASAKICAMGVRVSRWVSMHGLALNVTTNLEHFDLIVPCGLTGRSVTSMAREIGAKCPSMDELKRVLVETFVAQFDARVKAHG